MVVSLTFDDGNVCQYQDYFPILKKYGLTATFFIISAQIGMPGRLNAAQIDDLHAAGNEIASHTHTHPHLVKLTEEQLKQELVASKALLAPWEAATISYPYGEYDPRVMEITEKYFIAARTYGTGNTGINYGPDYQQFQLKTLPMENFSQSKISDSTAWGIYCFHGTPKLTVRRMLWVLYHGRLELRSVLSWLRPARNEKTELETFEDLCRYLFDCKDIEVVTVKQKLSPNSKM